MWDKIILGLVYLFLIVIPLLSVIYLAIIANNSLLWASLIIWVITALIILVILPYYWKNKMKKNG